MISKADVITMRIPFPTVDSDLAVRSHMYICIKDGKNKEFIKCQTFKPLHNIKGKPPIKFIKESPNIERNPFLRVTTIDCDKAFCVNNVTISKDLYTSSRKDICEDLFNQIMKEIRSQEFIKEFLETRYMTEINYKIKQLV